MNLHDKSLAISLDTGTHKVPGDGLKNACSVLLLPFICCDNYINIRTCLQDVPHRFYFLFTDSGVLASPVDLAIMDICYFQQLFEKRCIYLCVLS